MSFFDIFLPRNLGRRHHKKYTPEEEASILASLTAGQQARLEDDFRRGLARFEPGSTSWREIMNHAPPQIRAEYAQLGGSEDFQSTKRIGGPSEFGGGMSQAGFSGGGGGGGAQFPMASGANQAGLGMSAPSGFANPNLPPMDPDDPAAWAAAGEAARAAGGGQQGWGQPSAFAGQGGGGRGRGNPLSGWGQQNVMAPRGGGRGRGSMPPMTMYSDGRTRMGRSSRRSRR